MSFIDGLKDLGSTVAKFAPLLGGAIAGPGGAALCQLVSNAFGGEQDTGELIRRITTDPEAPAKLLQIELDHKLEIERIKSNQEIEERKADVDNTKSARIMNATTNKWVDEAIKCWIVLTLSVGMFYCLYLIKTSDVNNVEADILKMMLGAFLALFGTIVTFYFGAAFKSFVSKA